MIGKTITIIVTDEKIFYDWKKDKRSTEPIRRTVDCKHGYITKDVNDREIGITYMADGNYYGESYMLIFKKFEDELGKWRLVNTKFNKTLPFSELEKIMEEQEKYDELKIKI